VVVRPARTPCSTNARPQLVFVSLKRQHLWMCARHRVVRDTAITSGMAGPYTETPTGRYEIQGLNRNSVLTLNTGRTYAVKYWIPFDAPLFGFHDSSWQHFPYGSPRYRTAGSHGCVHVPLAAIRFLYHWARIGTAVRIKA
jgi:lipoprotein-anchoring transpeptidase ErfK/SrfK